MITVLALERANRQHFLLEPRIYDLCKRSGWTPRTNRHIDLVVDRGDTSVVFEMKSCSLDAIRSQLHGAVSQLLEYRYLYPKRLKSNVALCVVLEGQPRGLVSWLMGYLDELGIGLIWKNDADDRLNCTDLTKQLVRNVVPESSAPDF